jgi:hypothetical protein
MEEGEEEGAQVRQSGWEAEESGEGACRCTSSLSPNAGHFCTPVLHTN